MKIKAKKCYISNCNSPVGVINFACDETQNLIGLWFEKQKYFISNFDGEIVEKDNIDIFKIVKDWIRRYFSNNPPDINELPLKPEGNAFRQEIWEILRKIPYGKVVTYGDIASIIAKNRGIKKMSAQAVGGAISHNPISIIIPCHRVVGSNGSLIGYTGGLKIKAKLLELEGVNIKEIFKFTKNNSCTIQ